MKILFIVIACLFTADGFAQIALKEGTYPLGTCTVQVFNNSTNGWYEVSVMSAKGSSRFTLSPNGKLVGGINICNSEPWLNNSLPSKYVVQDDHSVTQYSAQCGGLIHPEDNVMQLGIDQKSGKILQLFTEQKIAKFSLPNGANSGPLKETTDTVNCGIVGSRNAVMDSIKAHSKEIKEFASRSEFVHDQSAEAPAVVKSKNTKVVPSTNSGQDNSTSGENSDAR